MHMRRSDKEINDPALIEDIISRAQVCRLALSDGRRPYIVPLCFGKRERSLFFHSAAKGKKIDILTRNPDVCFQFETDVQLIKSARACNWGMKYQCVIGFGRARIVTDPEAKRDAFDVIMAHYGATGALEYEAKLLQASVAIVVDIERLTGKASPI